MVFGLGIVNGQGGAEAVSFTKSCEGYTSALVAVMGFASSLVATYHGPLKPAMDFLKSFKVSIARR